VSPAVYLRSTYAQIARYIMAPSELSFIAGGSRTTLAYPFMDESGRGEVKMPK
jgi:ABC-type nitrate/sulfonate/bicarbonate transport system permease component